MTKRKVIEDSDDEENAEASPSHPSATGLSDITLSTIVSLDGSPSHEIQEQIADPSTSSTELLNQESRAAHKSLIEPTPKSTLPATRKYSSSQQQTPASPTTSRLETKRSKTSVEKPKAKKPLKTYGKSSQDIFDFHGGSDGELDVTPGVHLGHKAGNRKKNEVSKVDEAASRQASEGEGFTRKPIISSDGDTELLSTESRPRDLSSAGEKAVYLPSSMSPSASKFTSFEKSPRSESSIMPTTADPTHPKFARRSLLLPTGPTYPETHSDDRTPTPTRSSRGELDEGRSQGFVQSGNLHPMRPNVEMEETAPKATEEPVPSSSASEISPSKTITIKRTNQIKPMTQELSLHLDSEHLRSQLDSNMLTMANPVVLLPAPTDTEGGRDELSLSIPETARESPTKPAKKSKKKKNMDDEPVDELGSDDNAIGVPKEHYQPRPSKRRSGGGDEEIFVPTDFSKKPEAMSKGKRKTKRRKTTAFQELISKDEDEDEEFKVVSDPRFDIPKNKPPKISPERNEAEVDRIDDRDEFGAEAQPDPKSAAKGTGHKKRGRPKKVVTTVSEETVVNEAEAGHDQEEAEAEEPVLPAKAKKSRKKTNTRETTKPTIEEQDHIDDLAPTAEDDPADLPEDILNETHGNTMPAKVAEKLMPETSPVKSTAPPETPRKSTTPAPKGPDKHSPISSGNVRYRVGLSKRARIPPLLRMVRK